MCITSVWAGLGKVSSIKPEGVRHPSSFLSCQVQKVQSSGETSFFKAFEAKRLLEYWDLQQLGLSLPGQQKQITLEISNPFLVLYLPA